MTTVPLLFTVAELLTHFAEADREPTVEDIEVAGTRVGRNSYPVLVFDLFLEDLLLPDVAAVVVPQAWCDAEFPMNTLGADGWRQLFDFAGYTDDGTRTERPSSSMTLWRGALPDHRDGWAWTDDRALAEWFADRPHNGGRACVWVADVEPARMLARISQQRLGESEYVVDTRGLRILADSLRTQGAS